MVRDGGRRDGFRGRSIDDESEQGFVSVWRDNVLCVYWVGVLE